MLEIFSPVPSGGYKINIIGGIVLLVLATGAVIVIGRLINGLLSPLNCYEEDLSNKFNRLFHKEDLLKKGEIVLSQTTLDSIAYSVVSALTQQKADEKAANEAARHEADQEAAIAAAVAQAVAAKQQAAPPTVDRQALIDAAVAKALAALPPEPAPAHAAPDVQDAVNTAVSVALDKALAKKSA